jgi:hypothetical protein
LLQNLNDFVEGHLVFDPNIPSETEGSKLHLVLIKLILNACIDIGERVINIGYVIIVGLEYNLHEKDILSVIIVNVVLEEYLFKRFLEFVNDHNDVTGWVDLQLTSFDHLDPNACITVFLISLTVYISIHVEKVTWVKYAGEVSLRHREI